MANPNELAAAGGVPPQPVRAPLPPGFWNPRDTPFQRRLAFGGTSAIDQITGVHCEILDGCSETSLYARIAIMARGEAYLKTMTNIPKGTITLAIANAIAPALGEQVLQADEANLRGRKQIVEFLRREIGGGKRELCVITPDIWNTARNANGALHAIRWLGDHATLGTLARPADGSDLVGHYRTILDFLLQHPTSRLSTIGTVMYATLYISLAKQGNVSSQKLDRLNDDLKNTLGFELDLDGDTITYTYQQIGKRIPHEHLASMFEEMVGHMTEVNLRMQVTLQQAAGTGLTGLQIIKRALQEHPTFPWAKLSRMLPSETPKVAAAFDAVGNDPYYGFKPDLGAAKSTHYARYIWVCAKLLRANNSEDERTLRNYKGNVRGIPNQQAFDELIAGYTPPAPEGEPQVADEQRHNVLLAASNRCAALNL
nr:MAG: ORF3 [Lesnoe mivirus]